MFSVCCGAQAIDDTDICASCRDHSGFECLDCTGDEVLRSGNGYKLLES